MGFREITVRALSTPGQSKLSIIRGGSRGRVQGVRTPHPPKMTCGFLIQLVFCKKKNKNYVGVIGIEVEQETSAPPPKKNPGSAPDNYKFSISSGCLLGRV